MPAALMIIGIVAAVGAQAYSSYSQAEASNKQAKAIKEQTATTERLAQEQKAEAEKVKAQAAADAEALKKASAEADIEARKEDMRRRKNQTKTLLTDSLGDTSIAQTEKKTLLGG